MSRAGRTGRTTAQPGPLETGLWDLCHRSRRRAHEWPAAARARLALSCPARRAWPWRLAHRRLRGDQRSRGSTSFRPRP